MWTAAHWGTPFLAGLLFDLPVTDNRLKPETDFYVYQTAMRSVLQFPSSMIDRIPLIPLLIVALLLGLAPFTPEPHLVEKLRMLAEGRLVRPIDLFDLFLHATFPLLLLVRLFRLRKRDAG